MSHLKPVWLYHQHDPILIKYHKMGLDDYEIRNRMRFSVLVVQKSRIRLGLKANKRKDHSNGWDNGGKLPDQRPNPIKVAKLCLGSRMEEKKGLFWLDDLPVSMSDLMRETNRILTSRGAGQLNANPAWVVQG